MLTFHKINKTQVNLIHIFLLAGPFSRVQNSTYLSLYTRVFHCCGTLSSSPVLAQVF